MHLYLCHLSSLVTLQATFGPSLIKAHETNKQPEYCGFFLQPAGRLSFLERDTDPKVQLLHPLASGFECIFCIPDGASKISGGRGGVGLESRLGFGWLSGDILLIRQRGSDLLAQGPHAEGLSDQLGGDAV
jgi:hypothetical protein